MQNDMRDRLVELLKNAPTDYEGNRGVGNIADHLIANGVIVIDMNVISPENRPLITHFANMPLDDVLNLIKKDVVPVVKCSQCRKRYTTECALWFSQLDDKQYFCGAIHNDDFYCSYGERRTDDG